jgi:lysyl-tRNA synthetase class 2
MMDLVEEMVEKAALDTNGITRIKVGENIIDFKRPWKRYTMFEVIKQYTGIDISVMTEEELRKTAKTLNIEITPSMGKGKIIDEIFGEKCEPNLIQPTFIIDYPLEMSPLAKKHRSKEGLVERFEAIVNGKELCNAFSELNDPIDQRKRFEAQLELGKRGDEESMVLDEDFLRAIEFAMPPAAGLGIGIDRLVMIMTNSHSIQDVLLFPQMKPEIKSVVTSVDDFVAKGIPSVYAELIMKAGFNTPDSLTNAVPTKLFNDICGLRKKLKLDIKAPTIEEVTGWINNI